MAENIWRKTSLFIKTWKGSFWKYFFSELGGKIPFSRETGEEREITTIRAKRSVLWSLWGKLSLWGTAYKINPTDFRWIYFFHLNFGWKTPVLWSWIGSLQLNCMGKKKSWRWLIFLHSMKLEGKNLTSAEKMSADAILHAVNWKQLRSRICTKNYYCLYLPLFVKAEKDIFHSPKRRKVLFCSGATEENFVSPSLKVHKNKNFFGFDFEFCPISLLVMHK